MERHLHCGGDDLGHVVRTMRCACRTRCRPSLPPSCRIRSPATRVSLPCHARRAAQSSLPRRRRLRTRWSHSSPRSLRPCFSERTSPCCSCSVAHSSSRPTSSPPCAREACPERGPAPGVVGPGGGGSPLPACRTTRRSRSRTMIIQSRTARRESEICLVSSERCAVWRSSGVARCNRICF